MMKKVKNFVQMFRPKTFSTVRPYGHNDGTVENVLVPNVFTKFLALIIVFLISNNYDTNNDYDRFF